MACIFVFPELLAGRTARFVQELYYESAGRSHDSVIRRDLFVTQEEIDRLCAGMKRVAVSNARNEAWVPIGEYRKMELAGGMDQVLKIVCDGTAHECWMHLEDGRYQEYLY